MFEPEPHDGWLDGPIGVLRGAAIMLAGCAIGAVLAMLTNAGVLP